MGNKATEKKKRQRQNKKRREAKAKGIKYKPGWVDAKEIKALRRIAHREFDKLWLSGLLSREKSYQLLAGQLGVKMAACHISYMTVKQLKNVPQHSAYIVQETLERLAR